MNSYLSREEREHFVRATALVALLEILINGYASAKSTDPEFLKYLRMGRTLIGKALTLRADALDPEAKAEFHKQVGRLEFICMPKAEAKKAHAELVALKTTIPMEIQDFEDWYEGVVDTTCKTCLKSDYTTCQIRRVLMKYGVYPIDPEAKDKCQYCYVGTAEADKPVPEVGDELVTVQQYNLAVAEYNALDFRVHNEYLPEIEALKQKVNQLEQSAVAAADPQAAAERINSEANGLLSAVIGLANGNRLQLSLSEYMAMNLLFELQNSDSAARAICAQQIKDELLVVDMQEVITIQVKGIEEGEWRRPDTPVLKSAPSLPQSSPFVSTQADNAPPERYRVECKCGAEYFWHDECRQSKGALP